MRLQPDDASPPLTGELEVTLALDGLILRGGFHPEPGETGLDGIGTVLLVGNAGKAMWQAFAPYIDGASDPLNRWTRLVIEPVAERFGARAVYPFGETLWPFQRWAQRAEGLHPSPLGLLIHPDYGPWHAYRAALLFNDRLALPPRRDVMSPCATCAERPCLSACPVGAFSISGYDVPACASHLASAASTCGESGCHARGACPVGRDWRYDDAQVRFHMSTFRSAVAPAPQIPTTSLEGHAVARPGFWDREPDSCVERSRCSGYAPAASNVIAS